MFAKKFCRTPLAWFQLMKEKTRLGVAIAGIAFADLLMFVQMGLLDALYDSATAPYRYLKGDLVLTNRQVQTLIDLKSFPRERLQQVLAYEGVESVSGIYSDFGSWLNPQTRQSRSIIVWGVDPVNSGFVFPELDRYADELKMLDRVLFDRASRPEYGTISSFVEQQGILEAQISDRSVEVVGLFSLGASFGADGNVITSDSTFLRIFPGRQAEQIDIGVIVLKSNADVRAIQAQLRAGLPDDVKVITVEELVQGEINYWASAGTGFIFQMGLVVGFIVGIVIVYQILYSDVSDHLAEYATLKAMGYSDRYLIFVLMQEALILALLGFIPGFILSLGLYQITYAATLLPVGMKYSRAILVLLLTFIMCSVSGAIAMGKLRSADPADVF